VLAFGLFSCELGKRDSSDFPDRRSDMRIHIDARTGCHYLSVRRAGITPRLDKYGKQICTGREP
jgi:hypothetical protein